MYSCNLDTLVEIKQWAHRRCCCNCSTASAQFIDDCIALEQSSDHQNSTNFMAYINKVNKAYYFIYNLLLPWTPLNGGKNNLQYFTSHYGSFCHIIPANLNILWNSFKLKHAFYAQFRTTQSDRLPAKYVRNYKKRRRKKQTKSKTAANRFVQSASARREMIWV